MERVAEVTPESTAQSAEAASASLQDEESLSAGQYLDKALNMIGKKVRSVATLVRERSPQQGISKSAFESASDILDTAGRYMMRESVPQQLSSVVTRYPLRSLGACFLFGFAAGAITRAMRR